LIKDVLQNGKSCLQRERNPPKAVVCELSYSKSVFNSLHRGMNAKSENYKEKGMTITGESAEKKKWGCIFPRRPRQKRMARKIGPWRFGVGLSGQTASRGGVCAPSGLKGRKKVSKLDPKMPSEGKRSEPKLNQESNQKTKASWWIKAIG